MKLLNLVGLVENPVKILRIGAAGGLPDRSNVSCRLDCTPFIRRASRLTPLASTTKSGAKNPVVR